MATKVLVLGCGPAGLITACAAQLHGADVTIFSRKQPSVIYGAQWLQVPLDGLTLQKPDGYVEFKLYGDPVVYEQKVFGQQAHDGHGWTAHVEEPVKPAWDLRRLYDDLWRRMEHCVVDTELDAEEMRRLHESDWDVIFNCVPLWNLCGWYKERDGFAIEPHTFDKYKVRIAPQHDAAFGEPNVVIYNGATEDEWFRSSVIFGVDGGKEYPVTARVQDAKMVRKPQRTDCDCWPNVRRVGRYGAWDMNRLVHDGYEQVLEALA